MSTRRTPRTTVEDNRVWVPEHHLRERVMRRLKTQGLTIRRAPGSVGGWLLIDEHLGRLVEHVEDLELYARKLGALRPYERLQRKNREGHDNGTNADPAT